MIQWNIAYYYSLKIFCYFLLSQTTIAWVCTGHLLIIWNGAVAEKTKFLMVGTQQLLRRLPSKISISFLGKEITPDSSAKHLGIILDNNLTYDQHIHQLTSSCMTKLCQINRVKNSFDRDTLCTIISALVLSKLFYMLYSLVKHNCHKHQEASSCSEFRVQNHHKNKEIWAHNTCVTRDQMATSKWASPLQRHCNDI